MTGELIFDQELHRYSVGGVVIPSVTQILEGVGLVDYSAVRPSVLERKAEIGTQAHLACEYLDRDELDWESLDPLVTPYVLAYEKFKAQSGFTPRLIEHRKVASVNGMEFGMTLDREGLMHDLPYIIELKTAAAHEPSWAIQTAGYAIGMRDTGKAYSRAAVQLKPDGSFRVWNYRDRNDEQVFLWALGITLWKRNHSLGDEQ